MKTPANWSMRARVFAGTPPCHAYSPEKPTMGAEATGPTTTPSYIQPNTHEPPFPSLAAVAAITHQASGAARCPWWPLSRDAPGAKGHT